MRPKRRDVCQDCRSKKLACDGAQPECSQCVHRRIRCSGYPQDFVFVYSTASQDSVLVTQPKDAASNISEPLLSMQNPLRAQPCHEFGNNIEFIMQHYAPATTITPEDSNLSHNQICGAWVDALPLLAQRRTNDQPLVSAIETLATALHHHDVKEDSAQPEILEMYCKSLGHVKQALADAQGAFQMEHCAAVMCLAIADVVTPGLKSGWMTHLKGVGDMMEAMGPGAFNVGMMHTIFVGFRPLLLLSSILNQRATFLAREEWTILPFDGQPVSIMQRILNIVCKLPELLERYYAITTPSDANLDAVEHLCIDFHALLASLREWERTLRAQASHALVWSQFAPSIWTSPSGNVLWFPNMMVANSLTHYWAFEIVIRMHLSTLHQMIFTAEPCDPHIYMDACSENFGGQPLLVLADMICDSVAYLSQPEMKLHGLGSAFFILPTALRVFKGEQSLSIARQARYQQMVDLLASKGIEFPR